MNILTYVCQVSKLVVLLKRLYCLVLFRPAVEIFEQLIRNSVESL